VPIGRGAPAPAGCISSESSSCLLTCGLRHLRIKKYIRTPRSAAPTTEPTAIPAIAPVEGLFEPDGLSGSLLLEVAVSEGPLLELAVPEAVDAVKEPVSVEVTEVVLVGVGSDPRLLRVQREPEESPAANVGFWVPSAMLRYMSGPVKLLLIFILPPS
jgi:hypothetical protein